MELDSIPVFVKVAQLGSFTAASKALNMPNTTVSAKVASLERALGVTLIQRTTRKLNLTDAGRAYLDRAVRALSELQAAESEITSAKGEISGVLRLTSSVDIGHSVLATIVDRFLKAHPKMEVDLIVTNRIVDLVGEGVDLAIRAGKLKDSSLIAKRFIDTRLTLWASRAYLKKNGTPRDFKDLSSHTFVKFKPMATNEIDFSNGRSTARLKGQTGPIQADDFGTVRTFAEFGRGIAVLPDFMCEKDPDNKLERVLPEWSSIIGNFTLVYPAQQFVTPKVRAFIDVAEGFFKSC